MCGIDTTSPEGYEAKPLLLPHFNLWGVGGVWAEKGKEKRREEMQIAYGYKDMRKLERQRKRTMVTYLDVPFAEKDEAKRLGARWNVARKKWYIQDIEDLTPFMRWMPQHLRGPHHGQGSKN